MKILALLSLLLLPLFHSLAQATELDAQQEVRFRNLASELRCLVCQNQNIADSNAPLAVDLREQVKTQIVAGRSDTEIMRYLTDRYGDFVLYRPPFKFSTALLWLAPILLLILGLAIVRVVLRRPATAKPAVPANPTELQRLLDESER